MGLKTVEVTIKGTAPLMMHKYPMVPTENPPLEKRPPAEQAEIAAYRDETSGMLFLPGVALQRALVGAGTYIKGKGRATMQKPTAACVLVTPDRLELGTKHFEIDARPVVIKATGGRVIRYRPRIDAWQVSFTLEYDDNLMKESDMRAVVDAAGTRVGLLEFRPERKGPFGRFVVVKWE